MARKKVARPRCDGRIYAGRQCPNSARWVCCCWPNTLTRLCGQCIKAHQRLHPQCVRVLRPEASHA